MSIVTSLLKAGANAIFHGLSSEPLLLSEIRDMRDRNLKMMANFARLSGECKAGGNELRQARAEDCIDYALEFDTRLTECLSMRRTPGEDIHFRRVAAALEHLHDELGLPPVKKKAAPVQPPAPRTELRVLWLNGSPPAANA